MNAKRPVRRRLELWRVLLVVSAMLGVLWVTSTRVGFYLNLHLGSITHPMKGGVSTTEPIAGGIASFDGRVCIAVQLVLGADENWNAPVNRPFLRPATGVFWAWPRMILGWRWFVVPYWMLLGTVLCATGLAWLGRPRKQENEAAAE